MNYDYICIKFNYILMQLNINSWIYLQFKYHKHNSVKLYLCHIELTFNLLECGSVHIKPASINFTRFNPFNFFKHSDKSSLDSSAAWTHSEGGWRYLLHECSVNFDRASVTGLGTSLKEFWTKCRTFRNPYRIVEWLAWGYSQ